MRSPDEGQLLSVHPGAQGQAGVLSKGRDDHGEDESDEDKAGREDDLRTTRVSERLSGLAWHQTV